MDRAFMTYEKTTPVPLSEAEKAARGLGPMPPPVATPAPVTPVAVEITVTGMGNRNVVDDPRIRVPFEAGMREAVAAAGKISVGSVVVQLNYDGVVRVFATAWPPAGQPAAALFARLEGSKPLAISVATQEVLSIPHINLIRNGPTRFEMTVTKPAPPPPPPPTPPMPKITPDMIQPMGPGPWKALFPLPPPPPPVPAPVPPELKPEHLQAPVGAARKFWT